MMLNKKFSKVLCTILTLVMIVAMLPGMALVASADATGSTGTVNKVAFTDIADSPYIKEIGLLNAISVLAGDPAGTFRPNDTISRAEMAAIIVRISGLEASVVAADTQFTDVPSSHWSSGYVNIASSLGVINGDGDGTFRPDDKVTYNEAVKMLVCVLGYGLEANEQGGWPTGYLVVANDLAINDEVITQSGDASRETVAKLVYNALDIDYLEKTGFGEKEKWVAVEGRTLLSEKMQIKKVEGTVTETYVSSLVGAGDLKEGEVRIENTKYLVNNTDISDYIGYPVIAYTKLDTKVNKELSGIVYYQIDEEDMSVITLEAADIVTATGDSISIYEDETVSTKKITYTLGNGAYVFVNGVGDLGFNLATLTPNKVGTVSKPSFDGKVVIIDEEDDEVIDTLFVEKSDTLVVSRVVKSNGGFYILDQYGTRVPATGKFDLEDEDVKITVTKDGNTISYTDIKEDDVISYSSAGNVHNLTVCSDTVSGVVEEVTSDGEVVIDGNVYEYSNVLSSVKQCRVGDSVVMNMDIYGRIAYVTATASGADTYAYVLEIGSDTIMGDTTYQMNMITTDNQLALVTLASRVSFINNGVENANNDGSPYKHSDLTDEVFAEYGLMSGGVAVPQLIKFSKNADGEITSIETAIDLSAKKPNKYSDEEVDTFNRTTLNGYSTFYPTGNGYVSTSGGSGTNSEYKWKGVPFLFAPNNGGKAIEDDIAFGTADSFFTNVYSSYSASDFLWYDVDKDGNTGLIVGQLDVAGNGAVDDRGTYMLITKVGTGRNDDGQTVYQITGYAGAYNSTSTAETTITLEANVEHDSSPVITDKDVSELQIGDIINYKKMPNGKIYKYRMVYNSDEFVPMYVALTGGKSFTQPTSYIKYLHGIAAGYIVSYEIDGDDELITVDMGNFVSSEIDITSYSNYWKYDAKKGTLKAIDASDVPQPEQLDAADLDLENLPAYVHTVVDDEGNTTYWKYPAVVLQTSMNDVDFININFIYYDQGYFN